MRASLTGRCKRVPRPVDDADTGGAGVRAGARGYPRRARRTGGAGSGPYG